MKKKEVVANLWITVGITVVGLGVCGVLLMMMGRTPSDRAVSPRPVSTVGKVTAPLVTPQTTRDTMDARVAVIRVGGTCIPNEENGGQDCRLGDLTFNMFQNTDRTKALRHRACQEGWVNETYSLLVVGDWALTTDYNEDYELIQKIFSNQGITSHTEKYCGV